MSKRINIILPEQSANVLDTLTTKGNRSRLIDRALVHHIQTHGKQTLRDRLRISYQSNSAENLAIAAAWFPLEEEAQQMSENQPLQPTSKRARSPRQDVMTGECPTSRK